MATNTPTPSTSFTAEAIRDLLDRLRYADIEMRTRRKIVGRDYDDPGMRDFDATLSVFLPFDNLGEDDLPDWFDQPNWFNVPAEEMRALLANVNPAAAELAVAVSPLDDGVLLDLIQVSGSILNPYALRGTVHDALDARTGVHEALYAALVECDEFGHAGLEPDLAEQVGGVGDIALVTHVTLAHGWDQVGQGVGGGLLSQVLQDVAAGACAVLTYVDSSQIGAGTIDAATADLMQTLVEASFEPWEDGIWWTSTAYQAFIDPAEGVADLVG